MTNFPCDERYDPMPIATTNPATGEVIKTFEPLSDAQIEQKLQLAVTAFRAEQKTSFAERARRMLKAAEILERNKDKFAHFMTLEMGKPYKAAIAEAVKSASGCRYYAENAERFLTDEIIETGAKKSFIRYRPIGPDSGGDAVELPFLAGVSLRRSGADGGQCRTIEACLERSPMCPGD
jgi:acyl-CoA reductase-like NAD-dependent aldehyde dehydrogenase